jgi:hypothetical protein
MRLKKLWIVLGIVVFGGAGLLWVGGALFLNSAYAKQQVSAALSKAVKMPVTVKSISYNPVSGLQVKGVQVLPPDSPTPFFDATAIIVHARLFPLLDRKLIIDDIVLETPSVDWPQDENGRYFLPQFKKEPKVAPATPEPRPTTAPKQETPLVVDIRHVQLGGGKIVFRDKKGKVIAELRGVEFQGKPAGTESFSGKAKICEVLLGSGEVALQSIDVPFNYTSEGLELTGLTGMINDGRINAAFRLATAEPGSPMKLQANLEGVDVAKLLRATGNEEIGVTGKLGGTLEMAGQLDDPSTRRGRGQFAIADGTLNQHPALVAAGMLLGIQELVALKLVESRLNFEIKGESTDVTELTLASENVRVDAKGRVKKDQKLDLDADLSFAPVLLDRMPAELRQSFQPSVTFAGWNSMSFDIKGTLSKPKTNIEEKLGAGAAQNVLENALFDLLGPDKPATSGTAATTGTTAITGTIEASGTTGTIAPTP